MGLKVTQSEGRVGNDGVIVLLEHERESMADDTPAGADELAELFRALKLERYALKKAQPASQRRRLGSTERQAILAKTNGRCHLCGDEIGGEWEAAHVSPHSTGGLHSVENYLPAHTLCNNYRWDYVPLEIQYVMKLGVWAKTQVEQKTPLGMLIASDFIRHDIRRAGRRHPSTEAQPPAIDQDAPPGETGG